MRQIGFNNTAMVLIMKSSLIRLALLAGLTLPATIALAQKKPLDHSVYDSWKSLRGSSLSQNGKWLSYTIAPQEGDGIAYIKAVDGSKNWEFPRGFSPQFTADGKFAIMMIVPKFEDTRKARRDKVPPADVPKANMLVVNLETGEKKETERVASFELAPENSNFVVYTPEPPKPVRPPATPPVPAPKPPTPDEEDQRRAAGGAQRPAGAGQGPRVPGAAAASLGSTVVVRNLLTGKEEQIMHVASSKLLKDGSVYLFIRTGKEVADDGVYSYALATGKRQAIQTGKGKYNRLSWSDESKTLVWATDKDTPKDAKPSFSIYRTGLDSKPTLLVKEGDAGLPTGGIISDSGLTFSKSGARLFFQTGKRAVVDKPDTTPDDEKVSVDIWHYMDPQIQAQQLLGGAAARVRNLQAFVALKSGKVRTIGSELLPNLTVSKNNDGDWALGVTGKPYEVESTWNPGFTDTYLVNLNSGATVKVRTHAQGPTLISPDDRYLVSYDEATKKLASVRLSNMVEKDLSKAVPYPLYDEETDTPTDPNLLGFAGWTKDHDWMLFYDAFDVWAVDPAGTKKSICVTGGHGRIKGIRFRLFSIDPEAEAFDLTKPLYFSALNVNTKASGIYTMVMPDRNPEMLIGGDRQYTFAGKAKKADIALYTRQTFVEYPDLWVSDMSFANGKKMSETNPQQKNFNWGSAELITWTSNDGVPLKGILVKPENFDYSKKYPMIAYFYEKNSDNLHRYSPPAPSASTVNIPFFASNGYVMFIPDIPYKEGYPGESAISAIMPGVNEIVRRGYVDPKKLGIQGQSWGGYQVAYMVTETNMFAAACSGAAVSNMFSAYGGIRYGSGVLRQMQYEHGQSRLGATPWEKPLRYLENSPLFFADKIKTPLLMMHNDKDGAVPWTQGVELYSAMRRLQKACWMVTYNGEDHNLIERKNRKDWTIRLSQFFDYYLKDAPMPVWMKEGIPASQKGKTMGLELSKK